MIWYGKLDTSETVEIVNTLKARAEAGDTIFFDIYSDEEKMAEPDKKDTGLFFFRGNPGSEMAMEDLGRALSFLYDHAEELDINMESYSLWGGSADARMAATLGNSDALAYYTERKDIPQAAAVIMQYTGHNETSKKRCAHLCLCRYK